MRTPEFQAFLKIYNEGTKQEKLQFLDVSLLPNAHAQVYQRCSSLLSRMLHKQTEDTEAQCEEARFNVQALQLLRNGIHNGLNIDISKYHYV